MNMVTIELKKLFDDSDSRMTRARPDARPRAALIHTQGTMSAITQASAQVAKTVAVSTGKVSNAKSMMVWRPHGNKYVSTRDRSRCAMMRRGPRAAYLCGAMVG